MILVLLGAPGVGKGTQARRISKKFNIPHISTGDILRSEISKKTLLGKKAIEFVESGRLVPDELIIEIIEKELKKGGCRRGFLMDGFPRNLNQAKMFSSLLEKLGLKIDKVINLVVDEEEIVKRLSSRRVCTNCKRIYSFSSEEDLNNKRCPECGGELKKRNDDDINVIEKRLKVYEKETRPLVDYYADKGLLLNVDGSGTEQEVTESILKNL